MKTYNPEGSLNICISLTEREKTAEKLVSYNGAALISSSFILILGQMACTHFLCLSICLSVFLCLCVHSALFYCVFYQAD